MQKEVPRAVPPVHSQHHGRSSPGHAIYSGPTTNSGQMHEPIPDGMPGQPLPRGDSPSHPHPPAGTPPPEGTQETPLQPT